MRVPRVLLSTPGKPEGSLELSAGESYHLARVLRRSTGDRVILVAAEGGSFEAQIVDVRQGKDGPRVAVRVVGPSGAEVPDGLPWTLAVAVVKGEGFESAIRMAAELGVGRFLPVVTARTIVHPVAGSERCGRWRRIAGEAAKQCGRTVAMDLPDPLSLEGLLADWRGASGGTRGWILVPSAPLHIEALAASASGPALFLIGPEGGFTRGEEADAQAAGLEPAGFPTPVLRTPTAVALVAALGVLCRGPAAPQAGK